MQTDVQLGRLGLLRAGQQRLRRHLQREERYEPVLWRDRLACYGLAHSLRSVQEVVGCSRTINWNKLLTLRSLCSLRIRVYDYQAVCKDPTGHRSAANFLLTPLRYLQWLVNWMIGRASWVLLQTQLVHWINPDWAWAMEQEQVEYDYEEENTKVNPPRK